MRIKTISAVSAGAADNAAFAALQASTVNVAFTLTGAAASISPAREVTFTSGANLSAITYTVVGLDRSGYPITERIRGANVNTIRLLKVYSSITSVTPDTTNAGTMSVGYPQRVCTNWQHNNLFLGNDGVATAKVQAMTPELGEAFGAGIVEMTEANVMQISGEGAEQETTTLALATIGAVAAPQAAYFRIVNTSATSGQRLKVTIARPSF